MAVINKFLESEDDNFDGMLDAISELNAPLDSCANFHIRASRGLRHRLANHLGWKLELPDARRATDAERKLLDLLLAAEFPGRVVEGT